MAFTFQSPVLGCPNITDVTSIPPGNSNLPSVVLETQYGEERLGWDPALGSGTFIYLKGVAGLTAGAVVSYNALTGVTALWNGTANTAIPLAVAVVAPVAGQNGWFQVQGNAITNVSGTVAAGDKAYYQAAGVLSSTPVAGKQVISAVAALSNGGTLGGVALPSTQAVYTINRPNAQGAIT